MARSILGASLLSQEDLADAETAIGRAAQEVVKLPRSDPERLRSRLLVNWICLSRGQTDRARGDIDHLLEDMRRFGSAYPEDFAGAWRIRYWPAIFCTDSPAYISLAQLRAEIERCTTRSQILCCLRRFPARLTNKLRKSLILKLSRDREGAVTFAPVGFRPVRVRELVGQLFHNSVSKRH